MVSDEIPRKRQAVSLINSVVQALSSFVLLVNCSLLKDWGQRQSEWLFGVTCQGNSGLVWQFVSVLCNLVFHLSWDFVKELSLHLWYETQVDRLGLLCHTRWYKLSVALSNTLGPFMCVYICVVCMWCICSCMCTSVRKSTHLHMRTCMWRPEIDLECLSLFLSGLFHEPRSLYWSQTLQIWLD